MIVYVSKQCRTPEKRKRIRGKWNAICMSFFFFAYVLRVVMGGLYYCI